MAVAGWYGDPTREGRLRYWDGAAWTEHVSEGGGTATDPIAGVPPAPPAGPPAGAAAEQSTASAASAGAASEGPVGATQVSPVIEEPAAEPGPPAWESAAPAAAPGGRLGGLLSVAPGTPYPPTLIARGGFLLAAIGGVLTAVTNGMTAVDQGFVTISVAGGAWIGVVAAVLCVAAAAAPWVWARVGGVFFSGLFALLVAAALVGFRTSDDLISGVDVSLGSAGWLMFVGSLLLFAGTAIALAFFRVPQRGPDPSRTPAKGKAVVSLILGVLGVVFAVTAAPAVAIGLMGLDDAAADESVGGRGLARAGIILGIVFLALWGVGLLIYALTAQP